MAKASKNSIPSPAYQVVIVGAGPTGLAAAIELGVRGIGCLLLERDGKRGFAPRAKTTNVRTREIMRRWGIADALAKEAPFGIDYPSHIHFVTRLNGHRLVSFENALNCSPVRDERYSEHGQWVPQYKVEAVLKAKAADLGSVHIVYGAEFLGMEQDNDKVVTRIRLSEGPEVLVESDFLVGADGARSTVRDSIGAKMIGSYGLSRNYNIIFEAPGLSEVNPHGPGIMFWHLNPDAPGTIGPMDKGDLWYFVPTHLPADVILTDEEAVALIKRSTGIDLPYKILSSDSWVASELLADRYRLGRVFLAGDACHLHPPYGGYGMNMGIADSLDLGWKIAATLQGWGGPALLDSYEQERGQIHRMVLDEATSNHSVLANQLVREGMESNTSEGEAIRREVAEIIEETKAREFYALGIVLGLRYLDSPVIPDDGTKDDWISSREYIPEAAPGCLVPHAWLKDGRSLYDLFGDGFTLLALDSSHCSDVSRAEREAATSGIPLKIVRLSEPNLSASYGAALILVRPDQIVAWRGDEWPHEDLLTFVSGYSKAKVRADTA